VSDSSWHFIGYFPKCSFFISFFPVAFSGLKTLLTCELYFFLFLCFPQFCNLFYIHLCLYLELEQAVCSFFCFCFCFLFAGVQTWQSRYLCRGKGVRSLEEHILFWENRVKIRRSCLSAESHAIGSVIRCCSVLSEEGVTDFPLCQVNDSSGFQITK